MSAVPHSSYPFLGFTCAHRVVEGNVVLDDNRWQEVAEVLDERLHVGAPILTFNVGGAFLHMRPAARVLVAAMETPADCNKHHTPQPLAGLDGATSTAAPSPSAER